MKSEGSHINDSIFYILLIIFIILAYLYKNDLLPFFVSNQPITKLVEIEFKDKKYNLDFNQMFSKSNVEIAQFKQSENWRGNFEIEDEMTYIGDSSMIISAKDLKTVSIFLEKNFNLEQMRTIKMLIYSDDEENSDNIQGFSLFFGTKKNPTLYEYPILNIKKGWNIISMPKAQFISTTRTKRQVGEATTSSKAGENLLSSWDKISLVSIKLTARPHSRVDLILDRLWAEKDDQYQGLFTTKRKDILSLATNENKTYINLWPIGTNMALIKKVSGVKDFTYTAKIIPQSGGKFGINGRTDIATGYGYYLDLGGIDSSSWTLSKVGKEGAVVLEEGSISNFLVERGKPIWLRLQTDKNTIRAYISTDGNNFTRLTEKKDSELKRGGIGFQSGADFFVEKVEFSQ